MKADALFVLSMLLFVFVAWIATGGPSRPIATAGPWITPVTRSGEESQGYRTLAPSNPINVGSYPRQVSTGGGTTTISSGPSKYVRGTTANSPVYLEHSIVGPAHGNPNQEYISIVNTGTESVTLTGWRITSKATGATVIIPTLSVKAKGRATVVSGRSASNQLGPGVCGTGVNCVFLNRNLEVYASSRETITLKNTAGTTIDTFSY